MPSNELSPIEYITSGDYRGYFDTFHNTKSASIVLDYWITKINGGEVSPDIFNIITEKEYDPRCWDIDPLWKFYANKHICSKIMKNFSPNTIYIIREMRSSDNFIDFYIALKYQHGYVEFCVTFDRETMKILDTPCDFAESGDASFYNLCVDEWSNLRLCEYWEEYINSWNLMTAPIMAAITNGDIVEWVRYVKLILYRNYELTYHADEVIKLSNYRIHDGKFEVTVNIFDDKKRDTFITTIDMLTLVIVDTWVVSRNI